MADGGAGGGAAYDGVTGGAGGTGFSGAPGGNGGTDGLSTGGGGGGAAGGGNGGSGESALGPGAGGAGGTALLPDGGDGGFGGNGGGGGGGGGGFNGNGAGTATITNTSPLTAGNGGSGGNGGLSTFSGDGGGGGGGGGGYGTVVTGAGASSNMSSITGGNGGDGGAGFAGAAVSGNGGDGGVGVVFTAAGANFINSGMVTGGDGGTGGVGVGGAANGNPGAGGAGIVGSDLTITNSGTISGGLGGDGVTRANAITFTGGSNVFELQAGSSITGNVVGTGSDTFRLGGAANSTFDASTIGAAAQYQGFSTFVKTGSSTWTLAGTTTEVTPWTINQGTLAVSADSNLGANTGGLTFNGGTLQFGASFDLANTRAITLNAGGGTFDTNGFNSTVFQAIGGSGSLTKTGAGTLTLSGVNTHTGGTTVDAGTLRAGVAGAFVDNTAYAVNGGTLDLNGFNLTMSSLSGTGGTVSLGAAALAINQATDTSYAGALTGSGSLTKTGIGTLTLSGLNTYTGATAVDAGTLAVSDSIASSSITNNSALIFEGTSTAGSATITTNSGGSSFIADSASGGTARFILSGTGLLDISGLTAGGTTAGSIEGAGSVFLGSKNLAVGGNNLSTTFSGVIQNGGLFGGAGGSLTKTGAGTLTLSGVNTYTGGTTVNGGTLAVNGDITTSSGVTVNAGGTLGGNGIVGDTTITAGGALAPGNSIGLLTVQGNLVFDTASSYIVEVSPDNSDRTNVTGTATLAGATVNAHFAVGSYIARQYTILNATGGFGGSTFNALANTDLPDNFHTTLSYDDNNAYLNLILNFAVPSGLNGNQQNVANALTHFFDSTGGIPLVFGALSPQGLTQVSGEAATGSQQATFDAMTQFMGLMTDHFIAGRDDGAAFGGNATGYAEETALSYQRGRKPNDALAAIYTKATPRAPSFAQRWSVWAAGYGGSQTTDGNAGVGSNTATSRIFGTAVGADYWFSPSTIAGFALAGGGTNFSVANGGTGRSDLFQAGAFVRHDAGPAYISAALAYGWQDITTDRTITIAGADQLRARFNANAFSGRVEGGYRFVTPDMGITPYAAGQFTTFDLPGYAEQALSGANTFALAYGAKSVTASRSELGVRTDRSWAMTDAILTLRGRLAWAHDFNPDRSIAATFQTLPGASFVVNGAAIAPDAALTTASAEVKWLNGFSVAATFEGEFSDVTESYAGKGVVRYAW
jgi:autotransporter-associated beta strand protein